MAGYDKLTPEGEKFYAELEELLENEVFIGFQAGCEMYVDEETGKEVDLAQVAMFNELGTSTSPPRPFLRMAVDENQDEINAKCERQAKRIAQGASAEECLNQLGIFGKKLVQKKIREGTFIPNAPSTIKAKGSEKPLINTGHMRRSVNYVIKKKGT